MPSVRVKEGESIDSAIRRFKRAVEKAGIPKELRSRAFHQKGSVQKQRRIAAAKKRLLKKLSRERQMFDDNSRDRRH
jgi:small subunit ribosomal protein S21